MIKSPSTSDRYALCDWAELQAWASPRGVCTQGDIIKYLEIDDATDEYYDDPGLRESEKDEAKANDVLGVALNRHRILGRLYPFTITADQQLSRIEGPEYRVPRKYHQTYLFNLCFAGLDPRAISPHARHCFELEATKVLESFFAGRCFHFGWTIHNASIGKAENRIRTFCRWIGGLLEPADDLAQRVGQGNDLGIDAIVFKQVQDGRQNSLIVVGQCASGADWDIKLENSGRHLLSDCFKRLPTGPMINCFCTGFHIPDEKWIRCARRHDGILFDRLRIVLETCRERANNAGMVRYSDSRNWLIGRLRALPVPFIAQRTRRR